MGQSLKHRLKTDVQRLSSAVNQIQLFTLSEGDRRDLMQGLHRVRERLQAVEDELLVVGLLGGTGVGKSTLMNRLAGSDIASAGFRRPHTDKVLVYAHQDAPRPVFIEQPSLPLRVIEHQAGPIKQVLLCDLPDFDSLVAEHSETVNAFLMHLDLLVWVTSPEKYADRRMYALMRQVPKAGSNFVFVLNKADQLTAQDHAQSVEQLQKVSRSFAQHLDAVLAERGETGISAGSKLYVLSATETGPGWNQFELFQDHLFARRNLKQVARIKGANLEQELRQSFQVLQREMEESSRAERVLEHATAELHQDVREWEDRIHDVLADWVERDIKPVLARSPGGERLLVGPGRWIWSVANAWTTKRSEPGQTERLSIPNHVLSLLKDCRKHISTRVSTILLQHQLPDLLRERIEHKLNPDVDDHIKAQWQDFVRTAVREFRPRSRIVFMLGQRGVYALLTLLLLLALGGRDAWLGVLKAPGLSTGMDLFFALINTLFSATGLASLLSFGLLCSLAGARFFRRFRTVLDQEVQAYAQALAEQLFEHWASDQGRQLDKLDECRQELQTTIMAVQELVD